MNEGFEQLSQYLSAQLYEMSQKKVNVLFLQQLFPNYNGKVSCPCDTIDFDSPTTEQIQQIFSVVPFPLWLEEPCECLGYPCESKVNYTTNFSGIKLRIYKADEYVEKKTEVIADSFETKRMFRL